jgi:hypothetical protein
MRFQRPLVVAFLVAATAGSLHAQGTPGASGAQGTLRVMPSSRATSSVELAPPQGTPAAGAQPMHIRLDYGQPHLRGRALHTDSLVPYDQPWRTGANAPTSLTTDVDLVVGGQPVPKGTYVLWTLPSRSGWKLIVQRADRPGALQQVTPYDQANDVARVDLRRQALTAPVESLTMWLVPSTAAGAPRGELRMAWGTTMLVTDWAVRQAK